MYLIAAGGPHHLRNMRAGYDDFDFEDAQNLIIQVYDAFCGLVDMCACRRTFRKTQRTYVIARAYFEQLVE